MNKFPFRIGGSPYNGIGLDPPYTAEVYTLSLDRLTLSNSGGRGVSLTVSGFSTGLKYCEILINSGSAPNFGVATHSVPVNPVSGGANGDLGADTVGGGFGWGMISHGGNFKQHNNVQTAIGATMSAGHYIGLALDATNGFLYISVDGTFMNGGVPTSGATGTGAIWGSLGGLTLYFALSNDGGNPGNYTLNTGATTFHTAPPTGYSGF